jgi:hypothetical protein
MQFEWSEHKSRINRQKHGISFEAATLVFRDPLVLSHYDRCYHDEERWQAIGLVETKLIFVVYTVGERFYGEEEIIRIISARQASAREARRYCAYGRH